MATFPGQGGGSVTQGAIDALNVVTQDPITGYPEKAGVEIIFTDFITIDPVTDVPMVNGAAVPPAVPIAWADFIQLDWTQLGGLFYLVADVHSVGTTGGSLWMVDATGDRPILKDYSINVATMALAISTYPPATWPGLRLHVVDWDIYIISNGTRYLPVGGRQLISKVVGGTLASPTISSASSGTTYDFNSSAAALTLPAHMLAVGDTIEFRGYARKRGTAGTVPFRIIISTGGAFTDAFAWSATIANTDGIIWPMTVTADIASATVFTANGSASVTGTGATTALASATTNFDITSALIVAYIGTKTDGDIVDLLKMDITWIAK